ncbi:hypothetical protein QYF61_001858 [Mycteria americana]|uniref:Uncharacterized protein n=1 Tax=Mycteria americana TaxID=33587 RepID=A0AAN7SI65_MYCAM|nr:hypothetical protein QYF61_001858 [Mycteria americana]
MGDGNEAMRVADRAPRVSHPNSVTPRRRLRPPRGPKHRDPQPGPRAQQIRGTSSTLVDPSGEGSSIPQPHAGFASPLLGFKDILNAKPVARTFHCDLLLDVIQGMNPAAAKQEHKVPKCSHLGPGLINKEALNKSGNRRRRRAEVWEWSNGALTLLGTSLRTHRLKEREEKKQDQREPPSSFHAPSQSVDATTPVTTSACGQSDATGGLHAEQGTPGTSHFPVTGGDLSPTHVVDQMRTWVYHLRDGDSTTSLGSLFQCLTTLSVKKNFLRSSLNLPWRNLRPFPLVLSLVVVESNKVSPQPPFLQVKQPQLPQPLLIRLLRCPSLDTLQHLNVPLVVGGPKLNTGFEVRPHECQVQGHDHFPTPAGHAMSDTSDGPWIIMPGPWSKPMAELGDGDSTTSLGSLLQCLTTPSVNKFCLISNLNLPWCNFRPFPLVLSLVTWEKRLTPTSLQPPFRELYRAIRSLLGLLFSRLNNPSSLSCSSSSFCSRPFTSFVALLWTHSSTSMSSMSLL